MKINWFTVIAQVLNFLILVWLLRRFLYKPILDTIDAREKKIADKLSNAEAVKKDAQKEHDDFKDKNVKFDKEKSDLMAKAVDETNKERDKLLEATKKTASDLKTKLTSDWEKDKEKLAVELSQKTEREVLAMTTKALADLASASLDEQAARIFIRRLNELNEDEKKQFISDFKINANPILVKSGFELSSDIQTQIKNSVNKILDSTPEFEFKVSPELISGLELACNGYKLAWNVSSYLNSLQKSIGREKKSGAVA